MWKHIALFEWQYRRKRPATYLYFAILFLISFLLLGTDMAEKFAGGQIKQNATQVIANITSVLSVICIFIISAIMGVSIVRDFEHHTEALFFTAPITKTNYLLGRFIGSFAVLIFVLTAIPLGLMLAEFMPWRDADKLLSFRMGTYWNPFFVFILPNAFILGSLFFMVGALSRRMIVVFTQGMVVLLFYMLASRLMSKLDSKELVAILEPLGNAAYSFTSQYWSIAEKNTSLISLNGVILWNRLLWMGIGVIALAATNLFFSFDQVRSGLIKTKSRTIETVPVSMARLPLPILVYSNWQAFKNMLSMAVFYFRNTVRDLPFIALVFCGLAMSVFSAVQAEGMFGTKTLLTTYMMLDYLRFFTGLFCFIIMVLYVGNLVWMERDRNINLIHDALPINSGTVLIGKYLGLVLTFIAAFACAILIGSFLQVIMGSGGLIQWGVYIKSLYGDSLVNLMIYMLLGFFIHVIVNNKFAGHAIVIALFMSEDLISYMGIEHTMLMFNSGGLASFSDMNGFGDSAVKFIFLKSYWGALSLILFLIAIVLAVRGSEDQLKFRWKTGKYRLTKSLVITGIALLLIFVSTGAFVYYNTSVLNKYQNSKLDEKESGNYEKQLKQFENLPQPKITAIKLAVDLRPETRDFSAQGYYILKNKTAKTIKDIQVQIAPNNDLTLKSLKFDRSVKEDGRYADKFWFHIYKLDKPLLPGDSLRMDFALDYETKGFKNGSSDPQVVFNGTFMANDFFPGIGYSDNMELGDDDKRKKQGLKSKERMPLQTDSVAVKYGGISKTADQIRFDITVSTAPDQIALAPGYLQKSWKQKDQAGNEREYFHYKMDAPILNFYSIVSARYAVKKENYKGTNLEIYYQPGHEHNLNRMMHGMKAGLDYYQPNYGPYQSRQLRIMEFPRYRSYAQSFANTVPFSESMGFITDINDEKDVDLPFYVTAHEVAHQWWGHQTEEANVQGSAMLSESLAEYSALMVMNKEYSKEKMQKFLAHELDTYLQGRSGERKKEQPLNKVEGQSYIHYSKGSHVLYALQDQIGEATLNKALKAYLAKWNMGNLEKNGRYPITSDLIKEIRTVTPDSLQYMVTDLLETITIFDNRTEKITVKPQGKQYAVNIQYAAQKLRADSLGNERPIQLNDWIWVGVFGKDGEKKDDKLIYYQQYKINKEKGSLTVLVNEKPTRGGIDPLNLLIDRHVRDNVKEVE
jgi:ABC-2 type transport system permease protein